MTLRYVKKLVVFIVVGILISGCLPEEKEVLSDDVRVEIAGRIFKIPKGYFDGSAPTGRDTESVVLEYSLPDFKVLPEHPQHRAERQRLIDEGHMRGMLLENASRRPSLRNMVTNSLKPNSLLKNPIYQNQPYEIIYGLEKYPSSKPDLNTTNQYDDLFVERNKLGEIISFLRCSPPDQDKIPSCSHKFIDKGLLYSIRWRIQELPNWQEQRNAAIGFINSLEKKDE